MGAAEQGLHAPELKQTEERDAEERSAVRPHVVHEAIRLEGEDELRRSTGALAWLGLAVGLSMGFSLVAEGLLRAHLPEAGWQPLVAKFGYTLGFVVVIMARQQLFTENTLTGIIPLLARRDLATFWNVARLWFVVLAANVAGTFLFAWALSGTQLFDPDVRQAFDRIGQEALRNGFGTTFLRGIFAGWLIALMVWMLPVAHTSRLAVVILITYYVALGRFPHIVAGSVDVLYLVTGGKAPWLSVVWAFLLPTLCGNVVGGVALVSALNHAQVVAGRKKR